MVCLVRLTDPEYQAYHEDEFRQQGDGKQALLAPEAIVKELGIDKIALHVVAHNHVAQTLYEKTGFEITGSSLTKELTR